MTKEDAGCLWEPVPTQAEPVFIMKVTATPAFVLGLSVRATSNCWSHSQSIKYYDYDSIQRALSSINYDNMRFLRYTIVRYLCFHSRVSYSGFRLDSSTESCQCKQLQRLPADVYVPFKQESSPRAYMSGSQRQSK